jgi:hypothetical protein
VIVLLVAAASTCSDAAAALQLPAHVVKVASMTFFVLLCCSTLASTVAARTGTA